MFIPVPVIFKGSGFYVTDHARKTEAQSSPREEKSADAVKSETKSSSKENSSESKKGDTAVS